MKKTNPTEIERKIISVVKEEMDRPRLTESVRKGLSAKVAEKPAAPFTTA
jgi:hypothetical protein